MYIMKRHLADMQNGCRAGLIGSEIPCKRRVEGWHAEVVVMEECHCTSCISRQECPALSHEIMTATSILVSAAAVLVDFRLQQAAV